MYVCGIFESRKNKNYKHSLCYIVELCIKFFKTKCHLNFCYPFCGQGLFANQRQMLIIIKTRRMCVCQPVNIESTLKLERCWYTRLRIYWISKYSVGISPFHQNNNKEKSPRKKKKLTKKKFKQINMLKNHCIAMRWLQKTYQLKLFAICGRNTFTHAPSE